MELHPRAPQAGYGGFLREHDVGLALMFTPHPSLVPLEMASAGLVTVTNTFENKTADGDGGDLAQPDRRRAGRLGRSRPRSRPPPRGPTTSRRGCAAARWRWPRDWGEAFSDDVLDRVVSLLRGNV